MRSPKSLHSRSYMGVTVIGKIPPVTGSSLPGSSSDSDTQKWCTKHNKAHILLPTVKHWQIPFFLLEDWIFFSQKRFLWCSVSKICFPTFKTLSAHHYNPATNCGSLMLICIKSAQTQKEKVWKMILMLFFFNQDTEMYPLSSKTTLFKNSHEEKN